MGRIKADYRETRERYSVSVLLGASWCSPQALKPPTTQFRLHFVGGHFLKQMGDCIRASFEDEGITL
ncbi:hypothetical protein NQZ68_023701 [Dissostichus eleginoides]|nr:hypothetical protein NQZ68_023701 [Dissostichus eleginoides]